MSYKKTAAVLGALALAAFSFATAASAQRWDNRWGENRWGDPRGWRWQTLGCQDVNFRVDRDQIRISRHDGPFRALRLKAHGGDVEMFNLRVVYRDGFAEEVPVRDWIRAGRETRPLDIRGGTRGIRGIDMVYRAVPNYRGRANICVEALY